MSNPEHIVVLDLETTNSDPTHPTAAILEIGAIICQWTPELPEVARASMVIRPPGTAGHHDITWAQMIPVVREMHENSGLWREATTGQDAWSLGDADVAVAQWVRQHCGDDRVALLGAGIGHLDVPFIKTFMPRLALRLTYWSLDISPTRRMLQLAGREDLVDLPGDVHAKPHRALPDAVLHLAEARRYLQLLNRIPEVSA